MAVPQAPKHFNTEALIHRLEAKYIPTPRSVAQSIKPLEAKSTQRSMYAVAGRIDDETRIKLASLVAHR